MILSPSIRAYATCKRRRYMNDTWTLGGDQTGLDLRNNVGVGETNDDPVLGRVVLVLVLDDETLAGVVVRLSLTPPLEFDLVALEVRPVLDHFHERLRNTESRVLQQRYSASYCYIAKTKNKIHPRGVVWACLTIAAVSDRVSSTRYRSATFPSSTTTTC